MKYLIILIMTLGLIACDDKPVHAQTLSTPAIDTLDNAATVNMVPSLASWSYQTESAWTASVLLTRISGTAAGNVILQGSMDGTNYINIECPCSYAGVTNTTDSAAITNTASAQAFIFNCVGKKLRNVRVQIVGTGTQATQVKGYFQKD